MFDLCNSPRWDAHRSTAIWNEKKKKHYLTQEVRMRKDFLSCAKALNFRLLCPPLARGWWGHCSPPISNQDQTMLRCQGWKRLSYDAKLHSIPLEFRTSVLLSTFSPLHPAAVGSDGIPITSHRLVLTSSLLITPDHRLQSDCFQPLTVFKTKEKTWDSSSCYIQKHVSKTRCFVCFGTRSRSVHSARAGFPHLSRIWHY